MNIDISIIFQTFDSLQSKGYRSTKHEVTQMHLLFSNCVPILSHACAVKEFSSREMLDCNTAVNDAIRKIFSFHRWESVRDLRSYFGYKSLTDMFSTAKAKFENALLFHANPVLSYLQRFILASREQSED